MITTAYAIKNMRKDNYFLNSNYGRIRSFSIADWQTKQINTWPRGYKTFSSMLNLNQQH